MPRLDRCVFNASSGGTGTFSVLTAVQGYQTPASANAVNGATYSYAAQSADLTQWEVGQGAYTSSGTTLARTTVLFNSLGTTSAVNFSNPPQVLVTALDEDFSTLYANPLIIQTGAASAPSQRMQVTTGGQITIGGTSNQDSGAQLQLVGGTGTTAGTNSVIIDLFANNTSQNPPIIQMFYSNNNSVGGNGAVPNNAVIGEISFCPNDGSATQFGAAMIQAVADALATSGNAPTRLSFFTGATGPGTEHLRIDSTGDVLSLGTLGYGPATLAIGGTVTQLTSRTTGVTLSKICGAITLVSAAGTATWNTFTVTNTTVAATDVIVLSQKSGSNTYNCIVSAVAAGSFNISVSAVVGTATESPVINFAVIKAVAS